MYYLSTAAQTPPQGLSAAIRSGLAPDGGLFIPEALPKLSMSSFSTALSYPVFTQKLLEPFFKGDELESKLASFCDQAFSFPLPLKTINPTTFLLELFHGPTLSFKDFGARFLAEALNALAEQKITVMVATSGDTGSAVASAFSHKPQLQLIILYPRGKISARQEQQITCWDRNVLALSVDGNFDDCQKLVKAAFQDPWWQKKLQLSSANSINIARLLPQMSYYAYTSLQFYHHYQTAPGFIVPSGNLGNATAGFWAQALGFPIREIVLATNANLVIPDYLQTSHFSPRPSIPTLATAMDVGNPSNFQRLAALFPTFEAFKKNVRAFSASDEDIRQTILSMYQDYHTLVCPHTATACFARQKLSKEAWIILATADPCKFDELIEPILKQPLPLAPALQAMLKKPTQSIVVGKRLEDIKQVLEQRGLL